MGTLGGFPIQGDCMSPGKSAFVHLSDGRREESLARFVAPHPVPLPGCRRGEGTSLLDLPSGWDLFDFSGLPRPA